MSLAIANLEDFQALVDAGNFSRAAEQRCLTQPAFSRRIRALEEWVGAPLFERDTQPIRLTEAGRALGPVVSDVLRLLRQGREQALEAAARFPRKLRFAATHVLSFTFFPLWLGGLESGQPLEAVQLVSDSLQACEQLMLQGEAQFLLCHHHQSVPTRLDPADFPSALVGHDTLVPASTPDASGAPLHALRSGRAVPFLAYNPQSGLGRILSAAPETAGQRLETVFTSHLAAALRTMAMTGRGVAWLPLSLIGEDLRAGRLVRAGPADGDIPAEIRLLRPAHDLGPAAEAFWTRVAETLGKS